MGTAGSAGAAALPEGHAGRSARGQHDVPRREGGAGTARCSCRRRCPVRSAPRPAPTWGPPPRGAGSEGRSSGSVPHLGQQRVEAVPVVNVQDGQPELAPGGDGHRSTWDGRARVSARGGRGGRRGVRRAAFTPGVGSAPLRASPTPTSSACLRPWPALNATPRAASTRFVEPLPPAHGQGLRRGQRRVCHFQSSQSRGDTAPLPSVPFLWRRFRARTRSGSSGPTPRILRDT